MLGVREESTSGKGRSMQRFEGEKGVYVVLGRGVYVRAVKV